MVIGCFGEVSFGAHFKFLRLYNEIVYYSFNMELLKNKPRILVKFNIKGKLKHIEK